MRWNQVSIGAIAAIVMGLLGWLYMSTSRVNAARNERLAGTLRELLVADLALDRDVLRARQGLVADYDVLVTRRDDVHARLEDFTRLSRSLDRQGLANIDARLDELRIAWQRKQDLLERFKTSNSTLRNSVTYFPVLADEIITALRRVPATADLADEVAIALGGILEFVADSSRGAPPGLASKFDAIARRSQSLPPAARPPGLEFLPAHGRMIVEGTPRVEALLDEILGLPTRAAIETVDDAYRAAQAAQIRRSGKHRLALLLACLGLVGWVALAVARQSRTARALKEAGARLEREVRDRTQSLVELEERSHELAEEVARRRTAESEQAASLERLRLAADEMAAASAQLLAASSSQATGAAAQVEQVRRVIESLQHFAQLATKAAATTSGAADAATRSMDGGERGRQAVGEAVADMLGVRETGLELTESIVLLVEHARSIAELVGAIGDIASQTKLLAVNAAIEASRAGDAGSGFAVVAREVKALSVQSMEATSRVQSILRAIRADTDRSVKALEGTTASVEKAVRTVQQADEVIGVLVSSLADAAASGRRVSRLAAEQAAALASVSAEVTTVGAGSERTREASAGLAATARQLADLSHRLRDRLSSAVSPSGGALPGP